ncbi:MAG: hydroxyacylglutathione hydrolase [Pseudomonadota bacterium]
MIKIEIIPILSDNYTYFIQSDGMTAIVDPGDAAPVIDFCEQNNITLDYIINTHHHWDHTDGNEEIIQKYGCKVVAPKKEQSKIGQVDITLSDKDIFQFGDEEMLAIETPGHTQGHLCYWFAQSKILLSGDMIFAMGCGRPMEGNAKDLYKSCHRLEFIPDDALIYCGHEYTLTNATFAHSVMPENQDIADRLEQVKALREQDSITIPTVMGLERVTNPFLLAQSQEKFEELRDKRNSF